MSPAPVGEQVAMDSSRLHNGVRHVVTSWLSFIGNADMHHFDKTWFGKAGSIVQAKSGNVNYQEETRSRSLLWFRRWSVNHDYVYCIS